MTKPRHDQGPDYERGFIDGMQHQMQSSVDKAVNRMAQPEQEPVAWTPVATAMPKSGVVVLACYKNSADKVRRIRAQWIAAKTLEANGEFEDWSEYDEEADTYWTPEGWYECIDNWDEYSSVFVHEQITHWMPLPADPYTTPPQPKQEPVAWMHWLHGPVRLFMNKDEATLELERLNREYPVDKDHRKMRPLVFGDTTSPQRTWIGLTDEEREEIMDNLEVCGTRLWEGQWHGFAEDVEAKLKEKNT